MIDDVAYPYASGDPFADRKKYSYAAFRGRPFITAFYDSRAAVRDTLPNPQPAPAAASAGAPVNDHVETRDLLEFVYGGIDRETGIASDVAPWLARLVGKLEVTKRIHDGYGAGFRAVDRDSHRTFPLYVRLAEIFEAAYCASGELPYLNVLLKCMDNLCALAGELDAASGARLATLIDAERNHVETLAAKTVEVS